MTALFLVVLVDQCRDKRNRIPAFIGGAAAVAGRIFFDIHNMLIPAMIMMTLIFIFARKYLEKQLLAESEK